MQPLAVPPRSSHHFAYHQGASPRGTLSPRGTAALENPTAGKSMPFSLSTFLLEAFSFGPQALVSLMGLTFGNNSIAILPNNSLEAANIKPAVYLSGGRINKKPGEGKH